MSWINDFITNYLKDYIKENELDADYLFDSKRNVTNANFYSEQKPITAQEILDQIDNLMKSFDRASYTNPYPKVNRDHYPLKISKYFLIDGYIAKGLDDLIFNVMEETMKWMPELDTIGWLLKVANLAGGAIAGVNETTRTFFLSPAISYLHSDDIRFAIFHELRHVWQSQVGAHKQYQEVNGDTTHIWFDGTICTTEQTIEYLEGRNYELYHKLPWEADANGFAHMIMDSYIPHDPVLADSIKFSTDPRFLNYVPISKNY